jgi:hypothetical protein
LFEWQNYKNLFFFYIYNFPVSATIPILWTGTTQIPRRWVFSERVNVTEKLHRFFLTLKYFKNEQKKEEIYKKYIFRETRNAFFIWSDRKATTDPSNWPSWPSQSFLLKNYLSFLHSKIICRNSYSNILFTWNWK